MTPATRRLLAGVVAAVAVGSGVVWLEKGGVSLPPPASAGHPAPRFVARTLNPPVAERSLDDYAGHPLVLNVWATWCDPCRDEMPSLERLYRDYRGRGLRILPSA